MNEIMTDNPYTEEEQELDALRQWSAVNVMGWELIPSRTTTYMEEGEELYTSSAPYYVKPGTNKWIMSPDLWIPDNSQRGHQAWQIIEAMRDKHGYDFDMATEAGWGIDQASYKRYDVVFQKKISQTPERWVNGRATGKDPCLMILLAARDALEKNKS